jgi:hypothetical protein
MGKGFLPHRPWPTSASPRSSQRRGRTRRRKHRPRPWADAPEIRDVCHVRTPPDPGTLVSNG